MFSPSHSDSQPSKDGHTPALDTIASDISERLSLRSNSPEDSPRREAPKPAPHSTVACSLDEYFDLCMANKGSCIQLFDGMVLKKSEEQQGLDVRCAQLVSEMILLKKFKCKSIVELKRKALSISQALEFTEKHDTVFIYSLALFCPMLQECNTEGDHTSTLNTSCLSLYIQRIQLPQGVVGKIQTRSDLALGTPATFNESNWKTKSMPFESPVPCSLEWTSAGVNDGRPIRENDVFKKYVICALSGLGMLIIVDPPSANHTETYFVVVCRLPRNQDGNPVDLGPGWETAIQGDPLLSRDRCVCGELIAECTQRDDLCVVTRKFKEKMYSRRVYKDDEPIECVPVLHKLKLTPRILGNLDLLNARWGQVNREQEKEWDQLKKDKDCAEQKGKDEEQKRKKAESSLKGEEQKRKKAESSLKGEEQKRKKAESSLLSIANSQEGVALLRKAGIDVETLLGVKRKFSNMSADDEHSTEHSTEQEGDTIAHEVQHELTNEKSQHK